MQILIPNTFLLRLEIPLLFLFIITEIMSHLHAQTSCSSGGCSFIKACQGLLERTQSFASTCCHIKLCSMWRKVWMQEDEPQLRSLQIKHRLRPAAWTDAALHLAAGGRALLPVTDLPIDPAEVWQLTVKEYIFNVWFARRQRFGQVGVWVTRSQLALPSPSVSCSCNYESWQKRTVAPVRPVRGSSSGCSNCLLDLLSLQLLSNWDSL